MKLLALPLLALSVSAFVVQSGNKVEPGAESLTGPALVDYVNKKQNLWKAEVSSLSLENMKKKVMDLKYSAPPSDEERAQYPAPEMPPIDEATIPEKFDAREHWPHCHSLKYIRDQSHCGSCWAFGAAEAMSDRACIHSNGAINVELSANEILSCCGSACGGCQGGYALDAWKFWVTQGVVTGANHGDTSTCQPYVFGPCGSCSGPEYSTPACKKECHSGYSKSWTADKHYGKSAYVVANRIATIQQEIMTNGPVEARMNVYMDFNHYRSGVYVHTSGGLAGGHFVKLIGWGMEGSTAYWLAANSWGTEWGESGYFLIRRGIDECGIESYIVAGMPK